MRARNSMPAGHDHDQLPTFAESELPAITAGEFRLVEQEGREATLDFREGELEQVYNLRDPYSCILFVALCRREGVIVYRRPRQRSTTVCVRTTSGGHAAVWQRFVDLTQRFDAKLAETTQRFVHDEVDPRVRAR